MRGPSPAWLLPDHAGVPPDEPKRHFARNGGRVPRTASPADQGRSGDLGSRGRGGVPRPPPRARPRHPRARHRAEQLAGAHASRLRPRRRVLPACLPRGRLRLLPSREGRPRGADLRPIDEELPPPDEPERRRHLPEPALCSPDPTSRARSVLHPRRRRAVHGLEAQPRGSTCAPTRRCSTPAWARATSSKGSTSG